MLTTDEGRELIDAAEELRTSLSQSAGGSGKQAAEVDLAFGEIENMIDELLTESRRGRKSK